MSTKTKADVNQDYYNYNANVNRNYYMFRPVPLEGVFGVSWEW